MLFGHVYSLRKSRSESLPIQLEARGHDASTVSHHHIVAKSGLSSIHVASRSDTGKQRIEQNTILGFAQGAIRKRGN